MKIIRLFMLFPLLFNGFLQMMGMSQQDSDKLATAMYSQFMKTEDITASYRIEESEHHLLWKIQVEQQTKEEHKQKVKLQIHDEQNQLIPELANVEIPGLVHQEGWLTEEGFTRKKIKEFSIPLPKKYRRIQVTLQLDEMRQLEKALPTAVDPAVATEEVTATESKEILTDPQETSATSAQSEVGEETDANEQTANDPVTETILTEEPLLDILSEKEQGPYGLVAKLPGETSTTEETTTSESKEEAGFFDTVKANIGELLDIKPMAPAPQEMPPLFYPNMYPNKQPEYSGGIEEPLGLYPTHSWQPVGQENVLNHQGGVQGVDGWDGITSWDLADPVAQHDHSYIHYGVDYLETTGDVQPSVSLRKYAAETVAKDIFDMRLNVRGESVYQPGVDIVLLLDNTGSLGRYVNGSNIMGQTYTEKAVKTFITELQKLSDGHNIRLGGYTYSCNGKKNITAENGKWPEHWVRFDLTPDSNQWMKIHKEYVSTAAEGETFTQRGLMKAKEIFDAAPPMENRKKMLFVLTDGAPNVSYEPKKGTMTYNEHIYDPAATVDGIHVGEWNITSDASNPSITGASTIATYFKEKFPVLVEGQQDYIRSHIGLANSTAYDLKQAGIEIHTVGIDIKRASDSLPDFTKDQLKDGLAWMSTVKANHSPTKNNFSYDDFFYIDVGDFTDLNDQMTDWINRVQDTVEDGILTDPMSDYVEYIDGSLKVAVLDKQGQPIANPKPAPKAQYNANTRTLTVDQITLTDSQTLQVDYQVRLKGEAPGPIQGKKWYPANKRTTLNPMPERNTDLIDFGVPSLRYVYPESEIPVIKEWLDDREGVENFWKLRPDNLKVWLQTLDKNNHWTDLKSLDLNEGNQWQDLLTDVRYEEGQRFRIVERINTDQQVPGYDRPIYEPEEFTIASLAGCGVKVTNRLLTTDFKFTKLSADGKTPFPEDNLPVFGLFDEEDRLLQGDIKPQSDGTVLITGLPMGEFILKETDPPPGYLPMPDLVIRVTLQGDHAVKAVAAGFENYPNPTIINRLKDYEMTLHKEDLAGNELKGAVFKLTNKVGYEEIITEGPTFDFSGLKPGVYYLTEESPPEHHLGLAGEVVITVNYDGSVVIAPHELVEVVNAADPSNPKIVLKIKNITLGILPKTGGNGNKMIIYSGFAFAGFLVVGLLYLLINRRRGPT